jgi:hypothetical protein
MSFTIAEMYYEPAKGKPAEQNERIFEHNKIVSSFDHDEGQQQARAARQFWEAKFMREQTFHPHRMSAIAAGLAGIEEPWMSDIGYLTTADRDELMAFANAERQDLKQAKDPGLETLMKDLDARDAQEAFDLSAKHDLELQGSIEGIARPHTLERQEQNKKFAEERDRYTSEYHETRRLQDEIRDREKQEELERGQALEDDRGFTR